MQHVLVDASEGKRVYNMRKTSFSITVAQNETMADALTPLNSNDSSSDTNDMLDAENKRWCRCTTSLCGRCQVKWSVARVLTTLFYSLSIVATIVTSIELRQSRYKDSLHNIGWFVAGVFVCLAVPLSVYDISQHLNNFQNF